ncbi:MAG: cardiolipin synthase, partial [Rhodobacteraceae bacterium]
MTLIEEGLVATGLVVSAHAIGAVLAFRAARRAHTAQGAVAWAIALLASPLIAVPLYLTFGHPRLRPSAEAQARRRARAERPSAADHDAFERLAGGQTAKDAAVDLLVDGEAIFAALHDAIDRAERSLLATFFIIRDDATGRAFAERLIARAQAGVKVRLIYDAVGSRKLRDRYLAPLREAGVEALPFALRRGWLTRLHINFRNHRKMLVADGRETIIGGVNIGDEYLGLKPPLAPWRDTAVRIRGAAALAAQRAFAEDWEWAGGAPLDLDWSPPAPAGDRRALLIASGPADPQPTCPLFFCHAITSATRRIWIASPYFVPDLDVMTSLKLAALRGVDVRVLIPDRPDHLIVWLAAISHVAEAARAGVRVWRYTAGFMHQKALVIDDHAAAVGTANLDSRSFRLNFEISALLPDPTLTARVAAMLEADFRCSAPFDATAYGRLARFAA